jgi:hypothetical protein
MCTVGELRELIQNLPSNMEVISLDTGGYPAREIYATIQTFKEGDRYTHYPNEIGKEYLIISGGD